MTDPSHVSLAPLPGADITPARAILLAMLSLFALMLFLSLGVALRGQEASDPWNEALACAAAFPSTVLLGLLLYGRDRPATELLGIGRTSLLVALASLVIGAGLSLILSEVENLTRLLLPYRHELAEPGTSHRSVVGEAVSSGLVFPVCGELLFRGLLARGLMGRIGTWHGIGFAAALGALVMGFGVHTVIPAFVLFGIASGWLVSLTGATTPAFLLAIGCFGLPFALAAKGIFIDGYNTVSATVHRVPVPLLLVSALAVAVAAGSIALASRLRRVRAG